MTHEDHTVPSIRHRAPEEDYSLPDALTIPEYDNVEDSLAPLLEEDLED